MDDTWYIDLDVVDEDDSLESCLSEATDRGLQSTLFQAKKDMAWPVYRFAGTLGQLREFLEVYTAYDDEQADYLITLAKPA